MSVLEHLKVLCDLPGVSGLEGPVREYIQAQVEGHCDSCRVDPLGNLLVFKKGEKSPRNTLLMSAHMDEVGFIVTHIEESGALRFAPVGGIDSRVVAGKAVEVGPQRIYGVIGLKAVHQASEKEREEPVKLDKLLIDIGAESREQAAELVQIGDRAVFHAPLFEMGEDVLCGRALDDRAGCAMLIDLIRSPLEYDCHFAFTVLEETGCTGAVTAARAVGADLAVVVETTTAGDIAGVAQGKQVCRQGQGAVVSFMDKGTVYDHALYRHVLETAKAQGLPCQPKAGVYGGNESRSVQVSGDGVRTVAVSLPCRYLHAPTSTVRCGDIHDTLKLLRALDASLGGWEGGR